MTPQPNKKYRIRHVVYTNKLPGGEGRRDSPLTLAPFHMQLASYFHDGVRFRRFQSVTLMSHTYGVGEKTTKRPSLPRGKKGPQEAHTACCAISRPPLFITGPTQASVSQRLREVTLHPAASPVSARRSLDGSSGGGGSSSRQRVPRRNASSPPLICT